MWSVNIQMLYPQISTFLSPLNFSSEKQYRVVIVSCRSCIVVVVVVVLCRYVVYFLNEINNVVVAERPENKF
jgi:hypothetical protein